jgi:hypothetical protein
MKLVRAALLTLFFSGAALAQTPGIGETRPLPPSRQDPPPALGDSQEPRGSDVRPRMPSEGDPALIRCQQLVGAQREECLREERSAAGGTTRPAEPPTAPPPQNPR